MPGGLTMCELSVDDERQQSEQDDGDSNCHDTSNNWDKNWVQNEMTTGHKNLKMGSKRGDEWSQN